MKKVLFSTIAFGAILFAVNASIVMAEVEHGHDSEHGEAHWASPKEAATRTNPIKSDQASLDRGKQVFMTNCASCHGPTAEGNGPVGANLNPKPTNLTIMAGNHQDGDFEWKIANGRGAMPGWKSILNEKQRWDVVNYIQALENPKGKGNMQGMDHSNMSEEEMKAMGHGSTMDSDHGKKDHSH